MKSDAVYLQHILDEIEFLQRATAMIDFDSFLANETLTRATARSIEIIGEASKNLSADFRKRHKEIEWKQLAGMRDKLIHGYFGVNWVIVWDVITNKLPTVQQHICSALTLE
jgi:uncharacterized protein with HEPN domain